MKELPIANSPLRAIVDDDAYEMLSRRRWKLDSHGYPIEAAVEYYDKKRVVRYLHHFVLPKSADRRIYVDHVDGNVLNAQRSNLRYATNSQNQANRRVVMSRSGFKGVTRLRWGRYQAQIKRDGRNHYLGLFDRPEDAARAYAKKGAELFGEYHWHNAPPDDTAAPSQAAA